MAGRLVDLVLQAVPLVQSLSSEPYSATPGSDLVVSTFFQRAALPWKDFNAILGLCVCVCEGEFSASR
jgi:hypothetical protein